MKKYKSKYESEDIDRRLGAVDLKVGATYFDKESNTLYTFRSADDKEAWLESKDEKYILGAEKFEFSGTVSQIKIENKMQSNTLYFTTQKETALITCSFLSQQKGITDTAWNDFDEDFLVTVSIDRGGVGQYEPFIVEQQVINGNDFTFDVRNILAVGSNRVKVTARGVESNAVGTLTYSVNLTSMYLAPSNFTWNTPFIEGQPYLLGGINIGGNLNKVLKIKVSNEGAYSRLYEVNLGTQTYVGIAYYFDGLEFPTEGTGVYNVELWLDANGLESEHLGYNIICVSEADKATAQLIAVSEVPKDVQNYNVNSLFKYAVYNGGATTANPVVNVSAIINNTPHKIVSDAMLVGVATGEANTYEISLEIDSTETNIQLYSSIEIGDCKQEMIYGIDNSLSFPAVAGAVFYMNPANRNNADNNKTDIVNESSVASAQDSYTATWTDVSFVDGGDGWTTDNDGRKCLRLPAGSKVEIDYAPFSNAITRTIELSYRVENAADYSEDIITMASALTSDFVGARIKPTNVLLHSSLLKTDDLVQSYNTKDEELVHMVITIVQNYKRIGNLAQVYVNGSKKCSFEWSNADTFAHEGKLVLGSATADLYVYKMRVYTSAFEWTSAVQNFISCLPDTASKKAAFDKIMSVVNDGYQLDFDKVKSNGYNYFVLRLPQGKKLPSILSQSSVEHTRLEINIPQNPDFVCNGIFEDEKTEGQGTTAMNYFRWNLRWKTEEIRITAKKNYASSMHSHKMGATALFNDLNRMIVGPNEANGRVAVEQYGAYGFLEELIEGTTDQYTYTPIGLYTIGQDKGDKPTFGYNNKTYKPTLIHMEGTDHSPKAVGMDYPWDKLSVATNADGDANLGVVKADGSVIAAWEIGACGSAESDAEMFDYLTQEFKPAYDCDYRNTSLIVGLEAGTSIDDVNSNLSTFRATETDNGFTYADCLVWIDGEYDTYHCDVLLEKYVKDGLNILTDLGISASALTGSVAQKNAQIRELRKARYRADMESFYHLRDNLFHYCFLILFAATDNFKKNTYPYKFGTLASGSRWRWRQDDLDTLFDINNQGLANKIYSLLNGDKSGTTHLFRGNTSYHWTNIMFYFENEIKGMILEILTAMASLGEGDSLIERVIDCIRKYFWLKAQEYFPASAYNIDAEWSYEEAWAAMKNGTYAAPVHPLQQSLGSHYEAERAWVELRFIFMASLYGFGAFGVGNDSDTSLGQISFRPAQGDNTFELTPAINMNPTILVGDSDAKSPQKRLLAGEKAKITISTDGDTSIYVQGTDYLTDIGDFSKINLYAENPALTVQSKRLQKLKVGDENAEEVTTVMKTLNVLSCPSLSEVDARNVSTLTGTIDLSQCPRLRKALFGGSSAGEIILPKGSKIEEFELPSTITNLSLVNLPKLTLQKKEASVDVTNNYQISAGQSYGSIGESIQTNADSQYEHVRIPIGNVTYVIVRDPTKSASSLIQYVDSNEKILKLSATDQPATSTEYEIEDIDGAVAVYVSSAKGEMRIYNNAIVVDIGLVFDNLTALTYLRIEGSPNISAFIILKASFDADAPLTNIRLVGFDYDGDANDVTMLATLANGNYAGIDADGTRNPNILPVIEGTININGSVYEDDVDILKEAYGNALTINVTGGYYIKFADPEVLRVLLAKMTTDDGIGVQRKDIEKVTSIRQWFAWNTEIVSFDEFERFTSVVSTGAKAFTGARNLQRIKLPASLKTISTEDFYYCSSLQSIRSDSVTTVEDRGLANCTSMHTVELPNLKEVGAGSFCSCAITRINIPKTVTHLGSDAFKDCSALAAVHIADLSAWCKINFVTMHSNPTTLAHHLYLNGEEITNLVIPDDVTSIGAHAFNNCDAITSAVMHDSLTSLGTNAFGSCVNMVCDISNLRNITTLGKQVFYGCSKVSGIVNMPHVTSIGDYAFRSTKITRIEKLGIATISADSFADMSSVGYINFGDMPIIGACARCSSLTTFDFNPEVVTKVLSFHRCSSLSIDLDLPIATEVTDFYQTKIGSLLLPSLSVASRSQYCFANCRELKELLIGENLTSLGKCGFGETNALQAFVVLASTPVELNNAAPKLGTDCYMYVPDSAVEAYKTATNWSAIASKIVGLSQLPTLNPEFYAKCAKYVDSYINK